MPEANENKSWWVTLPGLITAVATLVSALGGFILIFRQNEHQKNKEIATISSPIPGTKNVPESGDTQIISNAIVKENLPTTLNKFLFKGNVGKLAAFFNLTLNYTEQNIYGTYYYVKRPAKIYKLSGVLNENELELSEFTENIVTAKCRLKKSSNDCYEGKMYNTDGREFEMAFCKVDE